MSFNSELKAYFQIVWRHKWLIAICSVAALAVALSLSYVLPPAYSATTTLRLSPAPGGVFDSSGGIWPTRLSNTYVEIANSGAVLDEVAGQLNLDSRPKVSAELVAETELLKVTASHRDPAIARDTANTLANVLIMRDPLFNKGTTPNASQTLEFQLRQAKADLEVAQAAYNAAVRASGSSDSTGASAPPSPQADELKRTVALRQDIYGDLLQRYENARANEQLRANALTVFEAADLPESPTSPKRPLNAALGLMGGLLAGIILAFVLEAMDDTLRSVEDVQELTALPLLGQVPDRRQQPLRRKGGLAAYADGRVPPESAYQQLRARLLLSEGIASPASILITSAEPGAGKSTVAANLSVALAEAGHRVVAMDMDFRRPSLNSILNLPKSPGITDILHRKHTLDEVIADTPLPNLRLLPSGRTSYVPPEWMTPSELGPLIRTVRDDCDYLVVDAPAYLSVADPTVLATLVDCVVVVTSLRHTERKHIRLTLQSLTEVRAKVSGVVVNRAPWSRLYAYYSERARRAGRSPAEKKTATL